MINFYQGELLDIIPPNMKNSETEAVSHAVKKAMQRLQDFSKASALYSSFSELPEAILDLLAVELNTQYYDQTMPKKLKEQLITQTFIWYMHGGTPSVIQEFISTVFEQAAIEEWFDYGGEPYTFCVVADVSEIPVPMDTGTIIRKQVNIYKNVRSWLDSIIFKAMVKLEVLIEYQNTLTMIGDFYARNNREHLILDGTWFLDGTYLLNGYKTNTGLDFFPVILRLLGGVEVEKSGSAALSILSEAEERQRTETELKAVSQAENHTGYENQMGIWSQIGVFHELAAKILYTAQARHRILPDTRINIRDEAELDIQEGSNVGIRSQTAIQKSLGSRISFPTAAGVKSREEIRTTLRSGADFSIKETATTKVQAQAAIAVKTDLGLRAEKNLWYLDGTYLLDGTKLLNAAITNYKL